MIISQILEEVVTLPEAATIASQMGYSLDRSNLLRYAQSGRLVARKSQGAWLTPRSALQALIVELALASRGRPRQSPPIWAQVETTADLGATLAAIDDLRGQLGAQHRSEAECIQMRRELTVEAIYRTNRIEGNQLSLREVRDIVESVWAESNDSRELVHELSPA